MRFERAEFVVSSADTPPHSGWQPQALPDSWLHNHQGLEGIAWYRMQFNLEHMPSAAMALFVARVSLAGQFWLNGSLLNPEVRFTWPDRPIGDNMSRWPHLITLPVGLLRAGENVLHIRVQGFNVGGHGLWDVRIGTLEQLHTPWLVREIPQRIIPQVLLVLMAVGSLFGLLVWWRERQRGTNQLFTVVMVLWTLIVAIWVLPPLPLTIYGGSGVLLVLYITFYWSLLALFYRYSESDWRWYPPLLNVVSGLTLLSALAILFLGSDTRRASELMGLVMLPTAFLRVLATVMLVQSAWRKRSLPSFALAATEVLWFAGHLQVIGILAGWLPPDPFRLDPASSLPLYLVLLYFFAERLVREREQAIHNQQTAVSIERARILQDMHDGMGSQLITTLRLAKRNDADPAAVARSIEEALQDLRLIIDSLDAGAEGLIPRLANLRYRMEPRLGESGIRLNWEVQPLPELNALTPQTALGILRIVQEALNNAVTHGRPSVITVSVTRQNGMTVIGVANDGISFDPDKTGKAGHGLSGMRKRARELGGRLLVEPLVGGGTRVSLHLPLAPDMLPQPGAA